MVGWLMICILYGFPCEMDFSHHESPNPTGVACNEGQILRLVVRNPSRMKIHKKCIFSHTFTLQGTLVMLNTLRKVEYNENHVRWIYLTTILCMGESQKYVRTIGVQCYVVKDYSALFLVSV